MLAADEARHNLIYGITSTLLDAPDAYPEFRLWTVERDHATVGVLLVTPPYNLAIARPTDSDALPFAAAQLARDGVRLPGVTGAAPEADVFAAAWGRESGAEVRVRMAQGVYAATTTRAPDVRGKMRFADRSDRELLIEWIRAFQAEALPADAPHVDVEPIIDRRLASNVSGTALWETDGAPVSLAGYGGRTPHGTRIGPVYTPPELRRRGYAGALVAALTQHLLDAGHRYCFLYTDLANPTANRVYTNVGFELVCESRDYAFS